MQLFMWLNPGGPLLALAAALMLIPGLAEFAIHLMGAPRRGSARRARRRRPHAKRATSTV